MMIPEGRCFIVHDNHTYCIRSISGGNISTKEIVTIFETEEQMDAYIEGSDLTDRSKDDD